MVIFTKKFGTLDPPTHSLGHSPKKNVFFDTFPWPVATTRAQVVQNCFQSGPQVVHWKSLRNPQVVPKKSLSSPHIVRT